MRRIAAVVLGAACLLGVSTTTATAVPDPVAVITCAAGDLTALVDPAALGAPPEIPGTGCLAP
ncbi:hypothetical protein FGW37_27845 [Streptomyces rectiverticillatus]|uniref:hypothetical protein n=1 Tax=Streptomyces rectiverticillatus TaxID=173860 RepID=UPI0015C2DC48|nr:hypothetical protein [Streptomyces rectiverticillatus]QLE74899.1 hypothetical protein FGW37_27845 [Streptomyces rectiverticillatus]